MIYIKSFFTVLVLIYSMLTYAVFYTQGSEAVESISLDLSKTSELHLRSDALWGFISLDFSNSLVLPTVKAA